MKAKFRIKQWAITKGNSAKVGSAGNKGKIRQCHHNLRKRFKPTTNQKCEIKDLKNLLLREEAEICTRLLVGLLTGLYQGHATYIAHIV